MNEIEAYIYLRNSEQGAKITLPASREHIEDMYERFNERGDLSAEFNVFFECGLFIDYIGIDNINIYELNHLAVKLSSFDVVDIFKLQGAVKQIGEDNIDSVATLINLVMNMENMEAYPAENMFELGQYYIENNMVEEIREIKSDAYTWIIEHADYEIIGKEMAERTKGVFTDRAYVMVGEIEQLYDGKFEKPQPTDYVFKFFATFPSMEQIEIKLPMCDAEIIDLKYNLAHAIKEGGTVETHGLKCIVPCLELLDYDDERLDLMNTLAQKIDNFNRVGELPKFKAMIEILKIIDLDTLNNLCDTADNFDFRQELKTTTEYGKAHLPENLTPEMQQCLDVKALGEKLLSSKDGRLTDYGVLVPKDGINSEASMVQSQSHGMEIKF